MSQSPKGFDAEFLSKRLGRVCAKLGINQPFEDYEKNAEVAGTTLAAVDRSLESLIKQRDELLAEKEQNDFALLKAMLEIFDIMNNPAQFRAALEKAVEKRAAAITNAKSGGDQHSAKNETQAGLTLTDDTQTNIPAIVFYPAGSLGEEVSA